MMILRRFAILFCLVLAACSGSGDGDDIDTGAGDGSGSGSNDGSTNGGEPVSRSLVGTSGFAGGLVSADYDATTGVFTVTALGKTTLINRFPTADHGAMLAMRDAQGLHNAYYGEGTGTQVVVYSGGSAGNVGLLAGYGRVGDTELPLTGTGRFTGDYAGFTTTRRINGTARLDVDFAGNTVEGSITDREFRLRPDNVFDAVNPLSTVRLERATLREDGSFSGDTGGGQIVNGQILWNPATGSYAGLIGGASGDEAVGTISLSHQSASGAGFDEVGGFLATR